MCESEALGRTCEVKKKKTHIGFTKNKCRWAGEKITGRRKALCHAVMRVPVSFTSHDAEGNWRVDKLKVRRPEQLCSYLLISLRDVRWLGISSADPVDLTPGAAAAIEGPLHSASVTPPKLNRALRCSAQLSAGAFRDLLRSRGEMLNLSGEENLTCRRKYLESLFGRLEKQEGFFFFFLMSPINCEHLSRGRRLNH